MTKALFSAAGSLIRLEVQDHVCGCCKVELASVGAGSPGATVALRLLKERADSAEARAAAAARQIAELKASLQVTQVLW